MNKWSQHVVGVALFWGLIGMMGGTSPDQPQHRVLQPSYPIYLPLIVAYPVPDDYLAVLDSNGLRDDSVDVKTWAPGYISAIAVEPDGRAVVAGQITTADNRHHKLARLNPGGDFDDEFDPQIEGEIYAMALQSDGQILIGGDFTMINGVSRNRIARLSPAGDLDTTFDPGAGAGSAVRAIALQSDGKILLGGTFTEVGGTPMDSIARLNSDGSLDNTFSPDIRAEGGVSALAVTADGKILVGGHDLTPTSPSLQPVVRLNTDGSRDAGFDASRIEGETDCWAVQDDGKIILGGKFNKRNEYGVADVMRIDSNGALDESFSPYKYNWSFWYETWVHAILVMGDGKVFVGGGLVELFPGSYSKNYTLVRLGSNGVLDTYLDSVFASPSGVKSVEALAGYTGGRIIVGGTILP